MPSGIWIRPLPTEERIAREKDIVSKIRDGFTLVQVGKAYNISRERIRQIYKRAVGDGVRAVRTTLRVKKEELAAEIKKKRGDEIKFYCQCGKPAYYKDRSQKYCSDCKALLKEYRDPETTFTCKYCQKPFHPYRNWKWTKTKPTYCSMDCYMQDGGANKGRFI